MVVRRPAGVRAARPAAAAVAPGQRATGPRVHHGAAARAAAVRAARAAAPPLRRRERRRGLARRGAAPRAPRARGVAGAAARARAAAAAALADAVDTAPRDAAFLLLDDGRGRVLALLAPDADDADVLEARFCAQRRSDAPAAGLAEARAASRAFLAALDAAGWDTTTHLLDVGTPRVDWTRQPGDAAAPC